MAEVPEAAPASAGTAAAATPTRTRRRLSRAAKRVLLGVAGAALIAASATGFWATAAAFDERTAAVVAARDLPRGHVLSIADVTSTEVLVGDVPHIAWADGTPEAQAGLAITHALPAASRAFPQVSAYPLTF